MAALQSLNYLQTNDADRNTDDNKNKIGELVKSDKKVTIVESQGKGSTKESGKNVIEFDYKNGKSWLDHNGDVGTQSPALELLHELGHEYRTLLKGDQTEQMINEAPTFDDKMFIKSTAEQFIVNNYETPGAVKLKEGVRKSYNNRVVYYPTVAPTSREEKKRTK